MIITKLGHCCLAIEEKNITILTDPGAYSSAQNEVKNIHVILITHEHADHLHIGSLKDVLKNNPGAVLVTNKSVGKILEREGIKYQTVSHGEHITFGDVLIEGFGAEHAFIYETVPSVENTGYFINNKLFYPGDAFYNPGKPVDILALPVAGPWMRIADAMKYARDFHPKICFPVHDGMIRPDRLGPIHMLPKTGLAGFGITFVPMAEGSREEF